MRTKEKVLKLHSQGKTPFEIAKRLDITTSTVRYHLNNKDKKYRFPQSEKKQIILDLKAQGKSLKEVQKITGYKLETVRYHYSDYGSKSKGNKDGKGRNADRHLCKTCKYRNEYGKQNIWCFYWPRTGIERRTICEVENCTVYERGTPR